MNHQFCEFCGRHVEQIPFGGYSHSADRSAMCGGKPVRPGKKLVTDAGTGSATDRAESSGVRTGIA